MNLENDSPLDSKADQGFYLWRGSIGRIEDMKFPDPLIEPAFKASRNVIEHFLVFRPAGHVFPRPVGAEVEGDAPGVRPVEFESAIVGRTGYKSPFNPRHFKNFQDLFRRVHLPRRTAVVGVSVKNREALSGC